MINLNTSQIYILLYIGVGIIVLLSIIILYFFFQQKRLQKIIEGQPIRTIKVLEKKLKPDDYKTPELGHINYGREILLLFSNKKSLFSSKKIERTIVFLTFLIITIIYIKKNIDKLESLDFIEIIGLWLAYGGYNSLLNLRERRTPGLDEKPTDTESAKVE